MEEQQIQEFVHRAIANKAVQRELALDPVGVVRREGFSPRVTEIIFHLIPYLAVDQPVELHTKWWHA